ncbi:pentatricopeptide repeat-containing protein At1g30610, chloroplastic [Corylus avellana]|uniref:pentatricopeptide repeat-containing protein At1g30610, chloroplastic n=1 Tax=Corylus avellana TaxID=13451 RepID=UPI00286BD976|nr:pentatricopeptide repeat-containing protein At1g30610, chloroplastic [Corylus avellana]XP_059437638.1 pentatricopeptide repeat-containing protein At1g30610, chloroplastic [Corylus avellana]
MVGLIMTNGQMGVSYFERNAIFVSNYACNSFCSYGFLIPRRPIFPIGLNVTKNEKIHVHGVKIQNSRTISALLKGESDNRLVRGDLLEKEVEFKPSFDEYLKTMESVRVSRDKKQANNSKKRRMNDNPVDKGLFRTPPMEGGEEKVKLKEFEGVLDQDKVLKVVEEEGLSKNALGIMGKESRLRGKLNYKGQVSTELMDGIDAKEGNVNTKINKKPGREITKGIFSKHQTSSMEQESEYSNLYRSTKAYNAQGSSRALAPVQSKRHSSHIEGKHVYDAGSVGMLRKKGTGISQRDHTSFRKTFNEEKIGVRRDKELHGGLERKYIQVEEVTTNEFVHNNGKLTRSRKAFSERADDYGSEVERAAFKTFDEFNDVMDKPRVSRVEMEDRIQKLAYRLNGADIDMPEWMFAKTMRSARIRFSDHSILRVIQILGKLGNWRRVLQVIEWLQMRERFKSHKLRFIYTTALDVIGKANRPVEALNVFHSMQQHMSSYPDLVAYHCIAVSLGQAGYLKELFDVIDSMRSTPKKKFKTEALGKWDPRLEPDIVVYNAVLNACVQRKQWEGAFWVLQQLKQQGQHPSSTTYGLVMEVMFACGKYNLVHDFFRKLKKSSIPNALTYKVLVNTLWQEGKTDEAVSAVQDMERRGIVGSAALYYDLARCLCSAGRCQEALEQIEKICKVANKPLVVTYTGLIQACFDSGNIQDGAYVFNKMQNFCSPNLVTYNVMLKAYLAHGMFDEASELFHKMSEDGNHISRKSDYRVRVIPDIYTFNTMLDACIADKRWDDFENIYRRMLHHGYHFNAKRHLRMILDASRAGKRKLLETTWIHLAEADRTPPPPLIKERFSIKLENDDYISAVSCITSHPMKELQAFSKVAWLNFFKENAHRFRNDALFRLIHEVSILINTSESPNPVLVNLISACKEFCRTHMTLAEIKQLETFKLNLL